MMTEKVRFGDLHYLLAELGFKQTPVNGPYIVFKHQPTGVLHAFRMHRPAEQVDAMTLAAVQMTLVEGGFLEGDEFESALREASAKGKARTKKK